jgi:hypothetical protein
MLDPRIAHLFEVPEIEHPDLHHFVGHKTVVLNERSGLYGSGRWNNIISDNFGEWLSAMFYAFTTTSQGITLTADDGNTDTGYVASSSPDAPHNVFNYMGSNLGTRFQLGSGTTAPTRADYAIETAFGTAPENTYFNTGSGSYAGGVITVSGSVTAGGSGTVNEALLAARWYMDGIPGVDDYLLFRDAISPGVEFVAEDPLVVTLQLSL